MFVPGSLVHELAHAATHDACGAMPRDVCEVVAESVAYAVYSQFGLDLSLRSVDYVAGLLDRIARVYQRLYQGVPAAGIVIDNEDRWRHRAPAGR